MLRIPSLQSCVTFAAVVMLLAGTAQATPTAMNFSGHLSDGAGGVSGPVEVTFTLYDNADTADGVQWSETLEIIVDGGSFNVLLGGDPGNLIPASAYGLAELFVAIQVENEAEMSPRIRMASVPYAIRAAEAETLSGTAAAGFAKSDQSCSPGDKVTGIGSNGEILCAADVDTNTDTNTTYSGANFATSSQTCTGTQKVTGINGSGGVTCGNDIDTNTDTNTTYSGANFATSSQACGGTQKVTGINGSGGVTCGNDIDTNTDSNTNASTQCNGQYTFLNGDGACVGQQALSTGSNPTFAGVNAGGSKVTNVGAPTGNSDAATKSYVDAAAGGGTSNITHEDCHVYGPNEHTATCTATCPPGMKIVHSSISCSFANMAGLYVGEGASHPGGWACAKLAGAAGGASANKQMFRAASKTTVQAGADVFGDIWCMTAN